MPSLPFAWSVRLRELLLLVVVCGSITFAIAYNNYESFARNLQTAAAPGDTADYLGVYLGMDDVLSGHAALNFRDYRILVPYLAHLVPAPPGALFRGRQFDPVGLAVFRFAVLTALFNFATSVLVYVFCRHFRLSRLLSLLGAALYSTLTFVLVTDGIPHVDAVFFFMFGLGAYALLRRSLMGVAAVALVGIFVKEVVVLLAVLALLLPGSRRSRLALAAGVLPAVAAYLLVRYALAPETRDYFTTGAFLSHTVIALRHVVTLNGLAWVFMAFNLLWLPVLWMLRRPDLDPTLRRWALLIPVMLVVTALGGSDHFGRTLLIAYPAGIPLAMLGVQAMLAGVEVAAAESARTAPSRDRFDEDALVGVDRLVP